MKTSAWTHRVIETLQKNYENVFSTGRVVGDCSTGHEVVTLGFSAGLISVLNTGSQSIYLDLMASSGVSTGSAELMAGSRIELSVDELLGSLSLYTSATSSGGMTVDILALGE